MKKSVLTFMTFTLFCVSCSHNTESSKKIESTGAAIDDPSLNTPEGKKLMELGKRKDEMALEQEKRGFYRTGTIDRGKIKTEENSLGKSILQFVRPILSFLVWFLSNLEWVSPHAMIGHLSFDNKTLISLLLECEELF
ncbi:TPA: hypothetical protein ROX88_000834 [Bacillus pseudomycoides]|nr:hypothetical protein [Bacillus pseudomycoides]